MDFERVAVGRATEKLYTSPTSRPETPLNGSSGHDLTVDDPRMSVQNSTVELPGHKSRVYDSANRPSAFFEELIELYRYRNLVRLWTLRNLTLRYKRSVLGVLWTLIEPLMLMVILTVVFSTVFRFTLINYPIYILCGLLVYDFVARSTSQTVDEIIASQNLAQRIHLPRSAFAVAAVSSYLVNWGLALLPLLAIVIALKHPISWKLISVPLCMLLAGLFALGVGLLVATLGAFFHDVKLTYTVLLSAWFYATPIIYPMDIVPERLEPLFRLNPLFYLVAIFRGAIYDSESASIGIWLTGAALSLASVGAGWWVFTRWRSAFEYRI